MNLYIKRPIAIEISPNTAFDDVRIAWEYFSPHGVILMVIA